MKYNRGELVSEYMKLARQLGLRPDSWIVGCVMSEASVKKGIEEMRSRLKREASQLAPEETDRGQEDGS